MRRRGLIAFAGIAVISAVLFPLLIEKIPYRETEFSAYSDDWNDLSDFRSSAQEAGYETRSLISNLQVLYEVPEPEKSILIVTGVQCPYSSREMRALKDFIDRGGSLILADDRGYANSISREFGIHFYDYPLWDENFIINTSFINLTVRIEISYEIMTFEVLFNSPTAISSYGGATALASSSERSWLDVNRNGVIDFGDKKGPLDVIVRKGQMVFIGDASVFTNQMWDKLDNARFAMTLLEILLPDGGMVIFDESTHAPQGFGYAFYKSVSGLFVYVFTDFWIGIGVIVIVVVNLIVASRVVRDPDLWQHRIALHEPFLGNLNFLMHRFRHNREGLRERLREDILERVRIRNAIPVEAFRSLSSQRLRTLIRDRSVYVFVTSGRGDVDDIVRRVERWS